MYSLMSFNIKKLNDDELQQQIWAIVVIASHVWNELNAWMLPSKEKNACRVWHDTQYLWQSCPITQKL